MTIDFSKLHNPYDFANPVERRDLFSGRADELREIRYYLDEATKAPRPMNLALLGPRASGKTSLLNMIAIEAKDRDFCVGRINLNESDVSSQMAFFFKVFDAAFNAVCEYSPSKQDGEAIAPPFGGITGRTYQTYIDMISTYDTSHSAEWTPFYFPTQYAKAQSSGFELEKARISDQILARDFALLRKESKRPLVLLFDECDCLNKNVVLLEMLRNTFMNLGGYMLVLAGLPSLFPIMNDVFSPIIRQFKRIEVRAFRSLDDTRICVKKPLESLGIPPKMLFDIDSRTYLPFDAHKRSDIDIREIHELASGRPYEINLICHFLFKRIQMGKESKMELNLGVLDDLRDELEKEQSIVDRPIISAIRNLGPEMLNIFQKFSFCDGKATLDELWCVMVLLGYANAERARFQEMLIDFCAKGLLGVRDDGAIYFMGDDFDKTYIKYWAGARDVQLTFSEWSVGDFASVTFGNRLLEVEGILPFGALRKGENAEVDLKKMAELMGRVTASEDIFCEANNIHMYNLLEVATQSPWRQEVLILEIGLHTPTFTSFSYYFIENQSRRQDALEAVGAIIKEAALGAETVNSTISTDFYDVRFPSLDQIIDSVKRTRNRSIRAWLAVYHAERCGAYSGPPDGVRKLNEHHAGIALELEEGLDGALLHKMGITFGNLDDLERAEMCFRKSLEFVEGDESTILRLKSFAVVLQRKGDLAEAQEMIHKAYELLECLISKSRCREYPIYSLDETGKVVEREDLYDESFIEDVRSIKNRIEKQLRNQSSG